MTQDEALAYCHQHGLSPTMTRERRLGMNSEEARAFMMAYSTSDPAKMSAETVTWFNNTVADLDQQRAS